MLVILKRTGEELPVVIREEEEGFEDKIAAHSMVTYVMEK